MTFTLPVVEMKASVVPYNKIVSITVMDLTLQDATDSNPCGCTHLLGKKKGRKGKQRTH